MCSDPGQARSRGDRGAQPDRRGRRRLLAAHAREDLPPRRRLGRPQPVPLRDGQHPRALLLDPRRPGRATAKAIDLVAHARREGQAQRAARDDPDPGRPPALVIGGGIAGIQAALDIADGGHEVILVEKEALHRRPHEPAVRDLPDARLLAVHPHAAHGRGRPAPEHHAAHLQRGRGGRGLHRQLHVTIRQKARSVDEASAPAAATCTTVCPNKKIPSEFDAGLGTPHRHLHPVPPGGAQPSPSSTGRTARASSAGARA